MKLTPEQLKGKIRWFAHENNLRAQEVLQMVMFEQFLSRLEISAYHDNFIIKGGVLIASMLGINSRTTMDLDATIRGLRMESQNIEQIIKDIVKVDLKDGITFKYESISNIREGDQYENFRVHLQAIFGKMLIPMKIDITTGDIITPTAINYSYIKMFDERPIQIKAYPLETVLAEKYETIIRRNITTTRARDFYDFYTLVKSCNYVIDKEILKEAILNTAKKRNSLATMHDWEFILRDIRNEGSLRVLWENYKNENRYIPDIQFDDIVKVIHELSEQMNI